MLAQLLASSVSAVMRRRVHKDTQWENVRAVQIVRHVRAPSVWRESVLLAVQTVRSAPVLLPQPNPAPHLANTQTACRTTNRRVVVTLWTAHLRHIPLAIATVPSHRGGTSLTATRTASLALHVLPQRPSPASQQFVLLWSHQCGCRTTTTLPSVKCLTTQA